MASNAHRPLAETRNRWVGERGDVSTAVIVFPLIIALILFAIQVGLAYHARSLAQAAAQDALRATQAEEGSVAEGQAAAAFWVKDGDFLSGTTVQIDRSDTQVEVVVSADPQQLVPFWKPTVVATASGPVEVFRPESER